MYRADAGARQTGRADQAEKRWGGGEGLRSLPAIPCPKLYYQEDQSHF